MRGTPACSMMGTLPDVPSSDWPTKATGSDSRSWLAQAEDCSGEPSVTQVSSWSGRPAAPPSSVFTYSTAASAARRASGMAAGPDSWLTMARTIGSPVGAGRVVTVTSVATVSSVSDEVEAPSEAQAPRARTAAPPATAARSPRRAVWWVVVRRVWRRAAMRVVSSLG